MIGEKELQQNLRNEKILTSIIDEMEMQMDEYNKYINTENQIDINKDSQAEFYYLIIVIGKGILLNAVFFT